MFRMFITLTKHVERYNKPNDLKTGIPHQWSW